MREAFRVLVMESALAVLGGLLVFAFFRLALPAFARRFGASLRRMARRRGVAALVPLAFACVMILHGSTKNSEERGGVSEEGRGERESREEIADSSGEIRKQIADSSVGRVVGSRDPRDRLLAPLSHLLALTSSLFSMS